MQLDQAAYHFQDFLVRHPGLAHATTFERCAIFAMVEREQPVKSCFAFQDFPSPSMARPSGKTRRPFPWSDALTALLVTVVVVLKCGRDGRMLCRGRTKARSRSKKPSGDETLAKAIPISLGCLGLVIKPSAGCEKET